MRALIAILLSALLCLPWATKLAITVDFFAHQDYIAANLCENRNKPELHCNGKCILMQKLQLAEEPTSQPQTPPAILGFEFSGFLTTAEDESPNRTSDLLNNSKHYVSSENLTTSSFLADVFHPPRFIA